MNGLLASVTSRLSEAAPTATRCATKPLPNAPPLGIPSALGASQRTRSDRAHALLTCALASSLLCWACAEDTEAPDSDGASQSSASSGDVAVTGSPAGSSGTQSSTATSGAAATESAPGDVSPPAGSSSGTTVSSGSGTTSAATSSTPNSSTGGENETPGPNDSAGSGGTSSTDAASGAGGNQGQAETNLGGGSGGSSSDAPGAGGTAAASGGAASVSAGGVGGAGGEPPEGSGALLDREETVRIMPFGDSIVEAQEWRSLLASKLAAGGFSNVEFVGSRGDHEGHGGLLVTDVNQTNLSEWIAPNPADVVLFEIGTNDVWNGRDPSSILSAYELVMNAMRMANAEVVILVAQITPMSPDEGTCGNCTCSACMDRTVALNDAIAAWAPGFSTPESPVFVVDQWTGFDVDADTSDRVHPNSSGAEKVAQNWYDAIAALY